MFSPNQEAININKNKYNKRMFKKLQAIKEKKTTDFVTKLVFKFIIQLN